MADQSYAAIAAARHRRKRRPRLILYLFALFLALLAAAAVEELLSQATPQALLDLEARNPETQSYVRNYETRKDTHAVIDLSADVTPGTVPHFLQWDERWGYETYGGSAVEDMMGLSGCGPTALSMVAVALTGDLNWNPLAVAQYAEANGHYSPGSGTAWSLFSEGSAGLGLTCRELPLDQTTMASALNGGELLIASMGPGDFTEKGHFIVLCGWDGAAFAIRDPNSKANTARTWTYGVLESQIRGLWAFSG